MTHFVLIDTILVSLYCNIMVKKASTKKATTEDRLLGIETRLTRIENKLSDKDFLIMGLTSRIGDVEKSNARLEDQIEKFHGQFLAEFFEFRSKIYTLLDPIAMQLKKFNEEQDIHSGQHEEIYQDVQKLQKIHPQNQHQFA